MSLPVNRGSVVLMYHRICPPGPETRCYFARGTAVEPAVFAAQLDWLARHYRPASLVEVLAGATARSSGRGPLCALTFDDGYRDIEEHVLPALARWEAPVAVFPCAAPVRDASAALWFDRYYALLHGTRRRAGLSLEELGLVGDGAAPGLDEDLRFWVRGPLKERLQAQEPAEQARTLMALSERLDAPVDPALGMRLYLGWPELMKLLGDGHLVGSHGVRHLRLAGATPERLRAEVAGSARLLDDLNLGARAPRIFAYPDGSIDGEVEREVASAGFAWALGVDAGAVGPDVARYRVPRVNMRNVRPGEPGWPALLCASGGI